MSIELVDSSSPLAGDEADVEDAAAAAPLVPPFLVGVEPVFWKRKARNELMTSDDDEVHDHNEHCTLSDTSKTKAASTTVVHCVTVNNPSVSDDNDEVGESSKFKLIQRGTWIYVEYSYCHNVDAV